MLKTLPLFLLLFVALKLTDFIAWSWIWVLAPVWLPATLLFGLLAALLITVGSLKFLAKVL